MSKLPGKTAYSNRRRPTTRSAGFSAHPDATGGEWKHEATKRIYLPQGAKLYIEFSVPAHRPGEWTGFGGWYCASPDVTLTISCPHSKTTLTPPCAPNWSKFGALWQDDGAAQAAFVLVEANVETTIDLWDIGCGIVKNPGCTSMAEFVECDKPSYLKDLHLLSPEAHIWLKKGQCGLAIEGQGNPVCSDDGHPITLKSCNRCARFLPINVNDERNTLSFSNHCVANRPCKHASFGRLTNATSGEVLVLEYGFQLECRYCKKYCVNWAHNCQRTGAQMKEDGARRRYFELLITELFKESKQLAFKRDTGMELTDYVWERFEQKCFNCSEPLPTAKQMHLDHTRPLALLWPLDETATALCGPCNSSKSDRSPLDFYKSLGQLEGLSDITGIPLDELLVPTPNLAAIELLLQRLDWFFDDFLRRDVMTRERDGKMAAELVVKALQKTLNRYPGGAPIDLVHEYSKQP